MALLRGRVVLRDFFATDLDGAIPGDQGSDLVVGFAGLAKGVDLITDHSDEGLNGKHLGPEAGCCAQSPLRSHSFFDRVEFWYGFSDHERLLFRAGARWSPDRSCGMMDFVATSQTESVYLAASAVEVGMGVEWRICFGNNKRKVRFLLSGKNLLIGEGN
jgi:hypothetical protein